MSLLLLSVRRAASAQAKLRTGRSPGRISAIRQFAPTCVRSPAPNAGITPTFKSEDLPHPDGPTTKTKWLEFNRARISSFARLRP